MEVTAALVMRLCSSRSSHTGVVIASTEGVSVFSTKVFYAFLVSRMHATYFARKKSFN
jgi:hypothetical protein